LNDPQRTTDPIYLEIVYRSEVSESDPTNHHQRSATLKIEKNGLYNWNNESEQALADVEWFPLGNGVLDLMVPGGCIVEFCVSGSYESAGRRRSESTEGNSKSLDEISRCGVPG
jgi:hypothetical protein